MDKNNHSVEVFGSKLVTETQAGVVVRVPIDIGAPIDKPTFCGLKVELSFDGVILGGEKLVSYSDYTPVGVPVREGTYLIRHNGLVVPAMLTDQLRDDTILEIGDFVAVGSPAGRPFIKSFTLNDQLRAWCAYNFDSEVSSDAEDVSELSPRAKKWLETIAEVCDDM